jgi:amidophosphoribosyltransferase
MARKAGARKVYFASASPAVRYPNVYGIDMPATSEFVANERTEQQVADYIGADWLIYQDLDDLISCAVEGNANINRFDTSVFDGHYVTDGVDQDYLDRIEIERGDAAKQRQNQLLVDTEGEAIDLRNQT